MILKSRKKKTAEKENIDAGKSTKVYTGSGARHPSHVAMVVRLKDALRFDKHELDAAVEQHSSLYLEAQEQFEIAVSIRDAAKTYMEEMYAERSAAIRTELEKKGGKFTEQRIKDEVSTDKDYLDAAAGFLNAKSIAAQLGAIVNAFEHRKTMLRIEADLWLGGYWSDAALKAPREKMTERVANEARESMRNSRFARKE